MPRVLVVDHYDSYTWNLVHLIAAVTGETPVVVEHDATSPAEALAYDHVVLSPGPGHPGDPRDFAVGGDIIRSGAVPVLGVCLGMQGMVTAFGGEVGPVDPAHGRLALIEHDGRGVFAGLPPSFPAVRYHSLAVTRMPEELDVTATTLDRDGREVVMGVRHRSRPIDGVQFHPESILSEYGAALVANFLSERAGTPR